MTIRVKLFAILKERAGRDELTLDLPAGATVDAAFDELARSVPALSALLTNVAPAVNRAYANRERVLQEGDELALIPPVSGG